MQPKTQKAVVLEKFGKSPVVKEWKVPCLEEGELLVKVQASTVNPSDRLYMEGKYIEKPQLPAICGLEGAGTIVQAKGQQHQGWIGKRVCFMTCKGAWAEYSVTKPECCLQIDKDVPLDCAASGFINPLTATGFVENYKCRDGKGGIINTAAASSLGRMLNKLCQKQQIPLLNVVNEKEQLEILKKEGATHVIITSGKWQDDIKQMIKNKGFTFFYDALGGGDVTEKILQYMPPKSHYFMYGVLEQKPFTLSNKDNLIYNGMTIEGFYLNCWWKGCAKEETKERIRKEHSIALKNYLITHRLKELPLSEIKEAIELSQKKPTQGKVLLKIL